MTFLFLISDSPSFFEWSAERMHCNQNNQNLPPVFVTSIYPDIFTHLDAKIAEKTRISNAGLYEKMLANERMLNNCKMYTLKRHAEEVEKIRHDLNRLFKCSPGLDPNTLRPIFRGDGQQQRDKGKRINIKHKDVKLCQRCYIHHTPYKNIYYQNWWLKNFATQKEVLKLKFCQRY